MYNHSTKNRNTYLKALQAGISYTYSGDFFSKFLLLRASLEKQSILLITPSQETLRKYLKLSKDLWPAFITLQSYHDLHSIKEAGNIYCISVDDIEKGIDIQSYEKELQISTWDSISIDTFVRELQDLWYEFNEYEKPSSYSRKGDTIKVYSPQWDITTLSFWGDEVESISEWTHSKLEEIKFFSLKKIFEETSNTPTLIEHIKKQDIFCVLDSLEFHPLYEGFFSSDYAASSFDVLGNSSSHTREIVNVWIKNVYCENLEKFRDLLSDRKKQVCIYTRHGKMLWEFLSHNNFGHIKVTNITTHLLSSFSYSDKLMSKTYICDDLISKIFIKKRTRKKLSADVDLLLKIKKWDHIVHIDHGIGLFQGIIKKELWKIEKEYLEIAYKENDKLFVPITEVVRVSKYVGSENPPLTPLSGKVWEKKMKKIHEDIREIAESLLKNFAERKLRPWKKLLQFSDETSLFQSSFPYTYTHDQAAAIEDIFWDMLSDKNMDRLIVWDVGFGKTEIAFNAAYLALLNKKQVLFLSPLVVLTHEHYNKALERFKDLNINIWILSRLQSQRTATLVLKWLQDGSVDMVIGTHRILSEKTVCKRLGLMIVDEEHKFWVVDKEKIKNMKSDIDILSLSATPIPRSLNLALAWVRDISLLKIPPEWRKSIKTFVTPFNEKIIQDAGNTEFMRWWQIFFVHNRVGNIEVYKKQIQNLFPTKKIIITHGQLPGEELEERILAFKNKEYDILLSTTVIENGIDFSNVNTIFINECQSFWISQIHQLRGRVWRSRAQGYCYLLYRKEQLDSEAAKRIQTIVDYSYLWAWFELAMKDLEIRWGGDILWVRQSGQSKEIWVSLFLKMLEEKIEDLKNSEEKVKKKKPQTQIDLMISASIPDTYFLTETDKLQFYRELELIENFEDLEYLKNSLFLSVDLATKIPESIENLFLLLECQILSQNYQIVAIKKIGTNYQLEFNPNITLSELKTFLKLDKEVIFQVVNITKLRSPAKGFENDEKFIKYLTTMLSGSISPRNSKKIRLKRKA